MTTYIQRMQADLERQGARVKRTKKGLLVMNDQGTLALHATPSDWRAIDNDAARLRRIGLEHMDRPRDEYPPYVKQNVSKGLLEKARQALYDAGWPIEITQTELRMNVSGMTKGKILYTLGYRYHPEGKKRDRNSKVWVAPDDIKKLHEELKNRPIQAAYDEAVEATKMPEVEEDTRPEVVIEIPRESPEYKPVTYEEAIGQRSTKEEVIPEPEPEPEPDNEERIVLDSHGSWVVENPIRDMSVGDYIRALESAGLQVEIRVWREK